MSTTLVIVIAIVAAIAILVAAGIYLFVKIRRSKRLKDRFGPEYQRVVDEARSRGQAEATLHKLERRVDSYEIHALAPEERARYSASWKKIQAQFVDAPKAAVGSADELLGAVMSARGYPVSDFEQQAADLSVDHPVVVQNYRTAHDIAVRDQNGEADTEALRQAMIHYRALFADLVDDPELARKAS